MGLELDREVCQEEIISAILMFNKIQENKNNIKTQSPHKMVTVRN